MSKEHLLKALDLDKSGEWEAAHAVSQEEDTPEAHWLHAYLHRKEGDLANAAYWYQRAGRDMPGSSLEEEWEILYQAFSS